MKINDLFQKIKSFFKNKTVKRVSIAVLALVLIVTVTLITVLSIRRAKGDSDVNICTVVFNSEGGSSVPSQKVNAGSLISEPEMPERDGYVLDGWSYNGEMWDFDKDTAEKNMILDAVWCEAVVLNFKNGDDVRRVSVARGRAIDKGKIPSVEDSAFLGWYCGGVRWDESVAPDCDITLVAAYSADIAVSNDIKASHVISSVADAVGVTLTEGDGQADLFISSPVTDADKYLNLAEYIRYMPNVERFLSSHPELSSSDGALLSIPSRIGYGSVEYLPFIRADIVRLLLDGEELPALELTGEITDDVSPFIRDLKYSVRTLDGAGGVTELDKNLNITGNVLDILGDYLCYGTLSASDAIGILRYHIDAAYGGYYGTERSRLFLGESAAYDTDELVMLLMCVSAAAEVLSDSEMCILSVVTERELIYLMASLYGISDIDMQMHTLSVSDGRVVYRGGRDDISVAVQKINRLLGIGLITLGGGDGFMRYASIYESVDSALMPTVPPVSVRSVSADELGDEVVSYSRLDSFAHYSTASSFSVPMSVADDERKLSAVLRFIDYTYSRECLAESCRAFDGICSNESTQMLGDVPVYTPTDATVVAIRDEHGGSATAYSERALGAGLITPIPTLGISMTTEEQQGALRDIISILRTLSE